MGRFFSNEVEEALGYIYYDMAKGVVLNGDRGVEILEDAVANGDYDAMYFLARCMSGDMFMWKGHLFKEDWNSAVKLYKQSILGGSSIGILGGIRASGVGSSPEIKEYLTNERLRKAYNDIYEKAENGEGFCQYVIGNCMNWGDIMDIMEIKPEDEGAYEKYVKYKLESLEWFKKSLENGVYVAGQNIRAIYHNGEENIIAKDPAKEFDIIQYGAETLGNVALMEQYGSILNDVGDIRGKLKFYEKSAKLGNKILNYYIGCTYMYDIKDNLKAIEYFQKEIELNAPETPDAYAQLGKAYFFGENGVDKNYDLAVENFEKAMDLGINHIHPNYAYCLVKGYGIEKDYKRAMNLIDRYLQNNNEFYYTEVPRALMYLEGLGVEQNIAKGMSFIREIDSDEVRLIKKTYKKSLFGKWKKVL